MEIESPRVQIDRRLQAINSARERYRKEFSDYFSEWRNDNDVFVKRGLSGNEFFSLQFLTVLGWLGRKSESFQSDFPVAEPSPERDEFLTYLLRRGVLVKKELSLVLRN